MPGNRPDALGRFVATEPRFWLNLQARYDLEVASDALEGKLERGVEPYVSHVRAP